MSDERTLLIPNGGACRGSRLEQLMSTFRWVKEAVLKWEDKRNDSAGKGISVIQNAVFLEPDTLPQAP